MAIYEICEKDKTLLQPFISRRYEFLYFLDDANNHYAILKLQEIFLKQRSEKLFKLSSSQYGIRIKGILFARA